MFILSLFIVSSAVAGTDLYNCSGSAVKAAMAAAKQYTNSARLTYDSITVITPSDTQQVTQYEVNLLQWFDNDSFSLTYEVIILGSRPNCKAVRVELIGQE